MATKSGVGTSTPTIWFFTTLIVRIVGFIQFSVTVSIAWRHAATVEIGPNRG